MSGRQAFTNPEGAFRQEGLVAGEYRVEAMTDDGGVSPTVRVRVEDREESRPILLEVERGVPVRGTVRTRNGQPLFRAAVMALRARGLSSMVVAIVHTFGNGEYRIPGLRPGDYWLRVSHPEAPSAQRRIRVRRNHEVSADFRLDRDGASLAVRVKDAANKPVPHATVRATWPDGRSIALPPGRLRARYREALRRNAYLTYPDFLGSMTRTGNDGWVQKLFLPPDRVVIEVTASGNRRARREVTLDRAKTATVEMVLSRGP